MTENKKYISDSEDDEWDSDNIEIQKSVESDLQNNLNLFDNTLSTRENYEGKNLKENEQTNGHIISDELFISDVDDENEEVLSSISELDSSLFSSKSSSPLLSQHGENENENVKNNFTSVSSFDTQVSLSQNNDFNTHRINDTSQNNDFNTHQINDTSQNMGVRHTEVKIDFNNSDAGSEISTIDNNNNDNKNNFESLNSINDFNNESRTLSAVQSPPQIPNNLSYEPEEATIRGRLRPRTAKQLNPYLYERLLYEAECKARGIKPLKLSREELAAMTGSSRDLKFNPPHPRQLNHEANNLSFISENGDSEEFSYHEEAHSKSPLALSQKSQKKKVSASHNNTDKQSEQNNNIRNHHSNFKIVISEDEEDSEKNEENSTLLSTNGNSTPHKSTGQPIIDASDSSANEETEFAEESSDGSLNDEVDLITELERFKKKMRGVLPPSFLTIESFKDSYKNNKSGTNFRGKHYSTTEANNKNSDHQRGIAVRKIGTKNNVTPFLQDKNYDNESSQEPSEQEKYLKDLHSSLSQVDDTNSQKNNIHLSNKHPHKPNAKNRFDANRPVVDSINDLRILNEEYENYVANSDNKSKQRKNLNNENFLKFPHSFYDDQGEAIEDNHLPSSELYFSNSHLSKSLKKKRKKLPSKILKSRKQPFQSTLSFSTPKNQTKKKSTRHKTSLSSKQKSESSANKLLQFWKKNSKAKPKPKESNLQIRSSKARQENEPSLCSEKSSTKQKFVSKNPFSIVHTKPNVLIASRKPNYVQGQLEALSGEYAISHKKIVKSNSDQIKNLRLENNANETGILFHNFEELDDSTNNLFAPANEQNSPLKFQFRPDSIVEKESELLFYEDNSTDENLAKENINRYFRKNEEVSVNNEPIIEFSFQPNRISTSFGIYSILKCYEFETNLLLDSFLSILRKAENERETYTLTTDFDSSTMQSYISSIFGRCIKSRGFLERVDLDLNYSEVILLLSLFQSNYYESLEFRGILLGFKSNVLKLLGILINGKSSFHEPFFSSVIIYSLAFLTIFFTDLSFAKPFNSSIDEFYNLLSDLDEVINNILRCFLNNFSILNYSLRNCITKKDELFHDKVGEISVILICICEKYSEAYPDKCDGFLTRLNKSLFLYDIHNLKLLSFHEKTWEWFFNFCAPMEVAYSKLNFKKMSYNNWKAISVLLEVVLNSFNQSTHKKVSSLYVKIILLRCLRLISYWKWVDPRDLLVQIFNFFSANKFENIEGYNNLDFPEFILDSSNLPQNATLNDSVFHVYLKCVATGIQTYTKNESDLKFLPALIGMITPLNGRLFPMTSALRISDLCALSNTYALLLTLMWAAPSSLCPSVDQIRDVIVFEQAHVRARLLSIKAWYYLTCLLIDRLSVLREDIEWLQFMVSTTIDSYMNIRNESINLPESIKRSNMLWFEWLLLDCLKFWKSAIIRSLNTNSKQCSSLFCTSIINNLLSHDEIPLEILSEAFFIVYHYYLAFYDECAKIKNLSLKMGSSKIRRQIKNVSSVADNLYQLISNYIGANRISKDENFIFLIRSWIQTANILVLLNTRDWDSYFAGSFAMRWISDSQLKPKFESMLMSEFIKLAPSAVVTEKRYFVQYLFSCLAKPIAKYPTIYLKEFSSEVHGSLFINCETIYEKIVSSRPDLIIETYLARQEFIERLCFNMKHDLDTSSSNLRENVIREYEIYVNTFVNEVRNSLDQNFSFKEEYERFIKYSFHNLLEYCKNFISQTNFAYVKSKSFVNDVETSREIGIAFYFKHMPLFDKGRFLPHFLSCLLPNNITGYENLVSVLFDILECGEFTRGISNQSYHKKDIIISVFAKLSPTLISSYLQERKYSLVLPAVFDLISRYCLRGYLFSLELSLNLLPLVSDFICEFVKHVLHYSSEIFCLTKLFNFLTILADYMLDLSDSNKFYQSCKLFLGNFILASGFCVIQVLNPSQDSDISKEMNEIFSRRTKEYSLEYKDNVQQLLSSYFIKVEESNDENEVPEIWGYTNSSANIVEFKLSFLKSESIEFLLNSIYYFLLRSNRVYSLRSFVDKTLQLMDNKAQSPEFSNTLQRYTHIFEKFSSIL